MAQTHSNRSVLVLPGDGIGPEIMREVMRVMEFFDKQRIASFEVSEGLVGLDPAIHVLSLVRPMDSRNKSGHDG